MANFIISYDLNGSRPSHHEVDDFLSRLAPKRARVLETVWWIEYYGTSVTLRDQLMTILRSEDSLLVCECTSAAWHNLLVNSSSLKTAWERAA
jgi:hypothetical protein